MKFKVNVKSFLKALDNVNKAVGKSFVPALNMIKIKASEGGLELTGAGDDMAIVARVTDSSKLEIEDEGEYAVDKKLVSIVKALNVEVLSLTVIGSLAELKAGRSKYKLNAIEGSHYPRIAFSTEKSYDIPSDKFKRAAENTVPCVSTNESRRMLTGVNMHADGHHITMTACDSYRLSRSVFESDAVFDALVPGETLKKFVSFINGETVRIGVQPNKRIVIDTGEIVMMSRLLSYSYPNVDKMISISPIVKVTFAREEMLESLKRIRLILDGIKKVVSLHMKDMELSGTSDTADSAVEEIDAKVEGQPFDLSFDADFMIQALKTSVNDNVTFEFAGEMRPFSLTETDDGFTNIQTMLPIRTK